MKRVGSRGKLPAWVRFWRKVEHRGACWIWTGSVNGDGYGNFAPAPTHDEPGLTLAHRWVYELATGAAVPGEMVLMHSCDTPSCVRPTHLSVGTARDNVHDMIRKGRAKHQRVKAVQP